MFRGLAQHKEGRIEEGYLMADHVHMMIAIAPKCAVSNVVGYIKGKSHSFGSGVLGTEEELCRAKFLGTRVFCVDRRER